MELIRGNKYRKLYGPLAPDKVKACFICYALHVAFDNCFIITFDDRGNKKNYIVSHSTASVSGINIFTNQKLKVGERFYPEKHFAKI